MSKKNRDMARAELDKPAKTITQTEAGGIQVGFEDGATAAFVPATNPNGELHNGEMQSSEPARPGTDGVDLAGDEVAGAAGGAPVANPAAPADAAEAPNPEGLAGGAGAVVEPLIPATADPLNLEVKAAFTFAAAMLGHDVTFLTPSFDDAVTAITDFVREYADASAEAVYIFATTRDLLPGCCGQWLDEPDEFRLFTAAFVDALRLADRLIADRAAAKVAEVAAAAIVPPPALEDTIFETMGADVGYDRALAPSSTVVVTPRPDPLETAGMGADPFDPEDVPKVAASIE